MEDIHRAGERRLVRRYQRHRLEAQLLLLAYELIRPVIRRRSRGEQQHPQATVTRTAHARSA